MKSSIGNMAGRAGKSFLAVLFVSIAGVAFAGLSDVRTWTGAAGDNKWGTAGNWTGSSTSSSCNVFPAGQDYTIIIEGSPWYFSIELPEGSGTVTFTGSGTLMPGTDAFVKIGAGREIKVDGPTLSLNVAETDGAGFVDGTLRLVSGAIATKESEANAYSQTFGGDAKLVVEGGTFGTVNGKVTLTNNATLVVKGGLAKAFRWELCCPDAPRESITRVRLLGGTFWARDQYSYTTHLRAGAHFENRGGTLLWGQGNDFMYNCLSSSAIGYQGMGEGFADFLPMAGGELVIPTSSVGSIGTINFAVDGDYDVGGTIYTTNNTDAAAGSIRLYGQNIALRGGATIYANRLDVNANNTAANYDLDLARLNLGIGGIRRTATNGRQVLSFLDGIVFGAWGGDVPAHDASYNFKIYLNGPVVYDTQDCFDPATSRDIGMKRLKMNGATEMRAVGGGEVTLAARTDRGAEELRTLEVADNTTLSFAQDNPATVQYSSEYSVAHIKTMNLKLGAGATLKLDLSLGDYVDASATAEFGEGAKIVVTALPATMTAGAFYPVYFAPAGTDPDLSRIEYEGGEWPAGWSLAKTGNAVYLTDGNISPDSTARSGSTRNWSGAGADNDYNNADNWVDRVSATSACHAQFYGKSNTVISVGSALALRTFEFFHDSGPFVFSGECISFQCPFDGNIRGQPTINTVGAFPVVVSNKLRSEIGVYRMFAREEGSISLTGGSYTGTDDPIVFGGDIRLGGNWTVAYLWVNNTWASVSAHNSRLTLMPGATLTVTGQTGDVNALGGGALAIARTAVATIGGTDLTLASNNTHYVDGALTVSCPLVPTGRQTFRGDGTLTLSGGVADAPDGGVRVEGSLTLVPASLMSEVELSVKDDVTIAPSADWKLGGDATLSIKDYSRLTLATGGHRLTLENPIVSEGSLAVTGGGKVEIAATGMSLGKVTCAGGATITVADALAADEYADVLTVREDDASIAFGADCKVVKRKDEATGRTVYSVKKKKGVFLIFR